MLKLYEFISEFFTGKEKLEEERRKIGVDFSPTNLSSKRRISNPTHGMLVGHIQDLYHFSGGMKASI